MAERDDVLGAVVEDMILGEADQGQDERDPQAERFEELQALVTRQVESAINWREEDLDPDQALATDYYKGKPYGNEEEGRSRVVSRDVKQVVQAMLPSLARIFFGPDKAVEFRPRGPEDVAVAEQKTDYVNYIVREDNKGFLIFHGWFKDAMVRKLGIVKWWWEEKEKVEGSRHSGLDEQALMGLVTDPTVSDYRILGQYPGPEGVQLYDCDVVRAYDDGRARFDVVAPEHFLFSPNARCLEEADVVGHVREVAASELYAMGFDEDDVEPHAGSGRKRAATTGAGSLADARRFDGDESSSETDEVAPERQEVLFGEVYVRFDYDGDGITELNRLDVIGDQFEILGEPEPVDDLPFATLTPDPEPNTIVGESVADDVMDIQKIKSSILRGMLDSLTSALNPRQEIVEGEVNVKDVMSVELGAPIRVLKPGMIREVGHDFSRAGGAAFPMLDYMDKEKEDRTGISKAAAGLDADALQSATKAAVAATLSGSQQHIEMLARIFAETGVADLYRGLLKLTIKHQDRERMVRLRNEWVPVDPKSWDSNMDVKVNLALGSGSPEEKVQHLMLIAGEMKEQLMQGSPLVSLVEYRNVLQRIAEALGEPNPQAFFKPFGEEQAQQLAQQQAQQPPPVNVEEELVKLEAAKLQFEMAKAKAEDDRKRDEMTLDFAAKIEIARMQYGATQDAAAMKASVDAANNFMQADLARRQALPDDIDPLRHPNSIGGEGPAQ
jgi:hypothetical protein